MHSVRCSARAGAAQSEAYLIRRLLANDLALLLAAGLGGCTYPASSSSLKLTARVEAILFGALRLARGLGGVQAWMDFFFVYFIDD